MALVKDGKFATDDWQLATPGEPLPDAPKIVVDLDLWNEHKVELCKKGGPLGIRLGSDQAPSLIASELQHFELVELEFPAFTDGRPYSYARLLRERFDFKGELRAVGDVLLEQLPFMHRAGFNAFELAREDEVDAWETAFKDIEVWYQPTADGRQTALQRRLGR